jgi:hypothetical protein
MKKVILLLICLFFATTASWAFGGPPSVKIAAYPYLVDNLEDGTYSEEPEWFVFDNVIPMVMKNTKLQEGDPKVVANLGEYSLNLKGSTTSWYIGGIGLVLGVDASGYSTVDVDIYGYGEGSGRIKIELYDDDNNNAEVEVDKNWKPLYDDQYVYEIIVDWSGWKHLSIPISEFTIEGNGNKTWDPDLGGGSGGLIKLQIITVANEETGTIKYNIDNLELGISK